MDQFGPGSSLDLDRLVLLDLDLLVFRIRIFRFSRIEDRWFLWIWIPGSSGSLAVGLSDI